MKKILLLVLLTNFYLQSFSQPIFSERGYPEHFIAGTLIGGLTSYYVFKKTDNKFKAWAFGTLAASAVGFLKEAIDPESLSQVRNPTDAFYTSIGGAFGASIVIPLKRKTPKETPNISLAFKSDLTQELLALNSE